MSNLNSLWLKKETLKTLLDTVEKKGEKGVEITISINDEANQWGQNVASWVSQSKEQRDAKADRFYTGNGKTFWSDGKAVNVIKTEPQPQQSGGDNLEDDLPF